MTVQQQAKLFGATRWEYDGQYVDFYGVAGNFRGSSNMKYLEAKCDA